MISEKTALRAISTFWNQHGCAPTLRDIAPVIGVSTGKARHIVDDLADRGLVAREPWMSRTMRLTPAGIEALEGTFPMVPFTDAALAEIGPTQVVCHLQPLLLLEADLTPGGAS